MAKALLSSLDRVSVGEREQEREREIECLVQRACIINEITLADGSYLGNVPQPPRFAAGSHAHIYTHTHMLFLALVKCAPDSLSLPFLALFTLCLSHPAFLSSSLCSSFIHRKIWLKRPGFQAKKLLPCTPPISLRLPHSSPFHCFLRPHQDLSTPRAKSLYSRLTTSGLQFEEELYMS